jgi:hypothetical protein
MVELLPAMPAIFPRPVNLRRPAYSFFLEDSRLYRVIGYGRSPPLLRILRRHALLGAT